MKHKTALFLGISLVFSTSLMSQQPECQQPSQQNECRCQRKSPRERRPVVSHPLYHGRDNPVPDQSIEFERQTAWPSEREDSFDAALTR